MGILMSSSLHRPPATFMCSAWVQKMSQWVPETAADPDAPWIQAYQMFNSKKMFKKWVVPALNYDWVNQIANLDRATKQPAVCFVIDHSLDWLKHYIA